MFKKATALRLGLSESYSTTLKVKNFTGSTISVEYNGLPTNNPKAYKNFLGVWEASMIPWPQAPIKRVDLQGTTQRGSYVIDGLEITRNSYIVGYGVGPEITDIAASSLLRIGGATPKKNSVDVGLESINSDSLSIHYKTLTGYLPEKSGNWVGLYKGNVNPYYLPDPVGTTKVNSNSNEGIIGLNNVQIAISTSYTLLYFMGESESTVAAMQYFTTSI